MGQLSFRESSLHFPIPAYLPLPFCFWFVFKTVKNKQHSLGCKAKEKGVGGPRAGALSKAPVGIGQPKTWFSGRSTLTSSSVSFP